MNRRCTRLGQHPAHRWQGQEEYASDGWFASVPRLRVWYWCTGNVTVEGGHGVHAH